MARMNTKRLVKLFIVCVGMFVVYRRVQLKISKTEALSKANQAPSAQEPEAPFQNPQPPIEQHVPEPIQIKIPSEDSFNIPVYNDLDDYPRAISQIVSQSNKSCPDLRRPKPSDIKYRNTYWQVLEENNEEVLVISAFYDDRAPVGILPVIRMHTVMKKSEIPLYCQFWYNGIESPYVVPIQVNSTGRGENIHGIRYGQYLFSCSLPSNLPIPKHVSVSLSECGESSIFVPIYVPVRTPPVHEFGVCVAIAFGEVSAELVSEWIELNRMFGITEFNIYNGSMTESMKPIFQYYEKSGVLRVHQMPPPTDDFSMKGTKLSSPASLNDCMLRNMYRYRFIVVIDFDEFIVPYLHKNYTEMIADINREKLLESDYYAYTFRNVYYFKDFEPDSTQPKDLITMRYKKHVEPSRYLYAPKSFVDPRRCLSVFNHYCWVKFKDTPKKHTIDVSTDIATSHHYRKCGFKKEECEKLMATKTEDDHLLKYKFELENRVSKALQSITVRSEIQ